MKDATKNKALPSRKVKPKWELLRAADGPGGRRLLVALEPDRCVVEIHSRTADKDGLINYSVSRVELSTSKMLALARAILAQNG